ncbi:hypothetical protein N7481_002823 [Penicillium waksmanii]|uniref:uncharacterized protein n=1 Tax=Penicillium waksmanii TaxID=69791 RepID=UPI00254677D3|nr:uncharacterized protein N7481_002823 [Penicillium waksmanii]KAJ5995846.1 hypothetical protein N7481_002823 [Penicillium waksmanii]
MTAVATAPVMSNHENGSDHSPSRFTAVNGRESASGPSSSKPPGNSDQDSSSGPREPSLGLGHSNSAERQDHDRGSGNFRPSPSPNPNSNHHKRKRSESRELQDHSPRDLTGFNRGPLDRPVDVDGPPASNGAGSVSGSGSGSISEFETSHHGPASAHRSDTNDAPSSTGPWPDYDSQLISQAQRAQQFDPSDAHLADALQREAQGQERDLGTRLLPSSSIGPPTSSTYPSDRSPAAVQVAPKRKRVFSNRTKTGCMTCRRRKKKCDEQHPACNNCIRGGFLCEGYTSRSMWQKPSSAKGPVPLQSKDGYAEVGGQYLPETPQPHERPAGMVEHAHAERKMRPAVVDEGSAQPAYVPEHIPKPDYREVPPVHEMPPREGPPKPDYAVVPPIREVPPGPHPKASMPLFQGGGVEQQQQRPSLPPTAPMDTNSPQAQARMALSIEHQISGRAVSGEETEKEKMIRGELYRPFDVQLVEERDRCRRALWRFNNACNPVHGLSSKEQNRLLKEILVPPSDSVTNSPSGMSGAPRSIGSIGQGAVVESSFTCNYGYNIHIGEDVMISQGCLFVDDCIINIGAHTWIGPNVTLLSSMAHSSMQERKGSQSRYQGRPVTIEEDCYLGAGCTIYPGVHLGRGAYIAPGEVVKTHIVAYGFQGFKPSYM